MYRINPESKEYIAKSIQERVISSSGSEKPKPTRFDRTLGNLTEGNPSAFFNCDLVCKSVGTIVMGNADEPNMGGVLPG